jgi:ATP-dependent Clp protease adaptor protein ClpS
VSQNSNFENEGGVASATETRVKLQRPRLYKVLLHNDNFTTMEFVVGILMDIFHHNEPDAVAIMLAVHQKGVGVAGVFSYEIAESKASKVIKLAQEAGYPLLCTLDPDDES